MTGLNRIPGRFRSLVQHSALLFAGVGAAGFFVDLAILSLTLVLGAGPMLARACSFSCAVTFTWYANRRLTFRSKDANWGREWGRFVLANSGGGAVNLAVYSLTIWLSDAAWSPHIGLVLGSFAGLGVNYVASRFWAFKRT